MKNKNSFFLIILKTTLLGLSVVAISSECFADAAARELQARIDAGEAQNDMNEAQRRAEESEIVDGVSAPEAQAEIARSQEDETTIIENDRAEQEAADQEGDE